MDPHPVPGVRDRLRPHGPRLPRHAQGGHVDWNDRYFLDRLEPDGRVGLEIGCGTGRCLWDWVGRAKEAHFIDISDTNLPKAVQSLETLGIDWRGLGAIADAEALPYPDDYFDFVWSWGVLHHTPRPERAFAEVRRVLKPGGRAGIGLYNRNVFFSQALFPLSRLAMRLLRVRPPGREDMAEAASPDDLIRAYDGYDNPVGYAKKRGEWAAMMAGLELVETVNVPYPKRLLPPVVGPVLNWLQTHVTALANGIYFVVEKPAR